MAQYPPLDITPYWAQLNEQLISLVDQIPDDKMDWSPGPDQWNFRGILLHMALARHHWMASAIRDGAETPDVLRGGRSKGDIKQQLRLSWQRLSRLLGDPARLSALYEGWQDEPLAGPGVYFPGHWVAFHRLTHDVQHMVDIFRYLALLGVEHAGVETVLPFAQSGTSAEEEAS